VAPRGGNRPEATARIVELVGPASIPRGPRDDCRDCGAHARAVAGMVLLSASACASDFTFGDLLGKGSFGVVHKVERKGAYDRFGISTSLNAGYAVQP